jgi:hypothetical protein
VAAFNELIGSINRVRDYIREFFIFGWRSRNEYEHIKSADNYDKEKRRAELWFLPPSGDTRHDRKSLWKSKTTKDNKIVFSISLSGDTRFDRNPLYEIWKTKTFTQNDITLHFIILDLLSRSSGEETTVDWITEEISMPESYGLGYDAGTIRNKLNEYSKYGVLKKRRDRNRDIYSLYGVSWKNVKAASKNAMEAIDFFVEAAPLGVIGSHIQDEAGRRNTSFMFSGDFVAFTLDDEVLGDLLDAISRRREVTINTTRYDGSTEITGSENATPIKILSSVENGRRYVAMKKDRKLIFRELEIIDSIELGDESKDFYEYREELDKYLRRCWDISSQLDVDVDSLKKKKPEHVEMKLSIESKYEMRVLRRLMSEGRNGTVLVEVPDIYVYKNELWNALEIMPFVMGFTGYILSFKSDNEEAMRIFHDNIDKMRKMYK